ncbi:MBOAT family protein [Apodospora peruviana]|uniref:MBOAT family protein n=1 Tax=Apodospora peruviana TaxID=516989 RepID=A0AAE0I237_9PEZI|nr:MBOAT family protein [Apodospora peruviana]
MTMRMDQPGTTPAAGGRTSSRDHTEDTNDSSHHTSGSGNTSPTTATTDINDAGRRQTYLLTPVHSLRDALRATGRTASTLDGGAGGGGESGTTSEEDYDDISSGPAASTTTPRRTATAGARLLKPATGESTAAVRNRRQGGQYQHPLQAGSALSTASTSSSSFDTLPQLRIPAVGEDITNTLPKDGRRHHHKAGGGYIISTADDGDLPAIRDLVIRSAKTGGQMAKRRPKFADLVFSRTFSAFDRQNTAAANSPFHGFFTLFWMAVFFFILKIAADNWKKTGSPLGTNEIMKSMFRRDLFVLLLADGVMCGMTGVSWVLQRLVRRDGRSWLIWDRWGWVVQNIWQTIFIGGVVGLTLVRHWPWTHTVFFVMHGLVMLMKQHSYAFYNGYLSSAYNKRAHLLARLKQLDDISPVQSPSRTEPPVSAISTTHLSLVPSAHEYKERRRSIAAHEEVEDNIDRIAAAISSGEPLDKEQVHVFERILKWEVDALSDELKGKSTDPARAYPNNLTLDNHYEFIVLPTLVYELEYPRSESINWYYVAEKMAACFGIIFVMIMISQAFIYPVVMDTVRMKETGMPLAQRFSRFPWMLSDLIIPFMMEYLLAWYVIWETILNLLAELTYFADRSFYDAWWNSVSWDQFARDWNRPVHNFLLRHVYHSSISAMKVNKHTATLITFFLSACVHELVMWCIFKKLRGYLLFLQMCQLPLVRLSRTKWLRHKATLGNMIFWLGIFTGPSILCSLYLIL